MVDGARRAGAGPTALRVAASLGASSYSLGEIFGPLCGTGLTSAFGFPAAMLGIGSAVTVWGVVHAVATGWGDVLALWMDGCRGGGTKGPYVSLG